MQLGPMFLKQSRDKRQLTVDENLRRINAKRSSCNYQPGQKILKKKYEWTKIGERWDGSFEIEIKMSIGR